MAIASGSFHVTDWDEKTYAEFDGGGKLTRARIGQDFHGDLDAKGAWELVMSYREDGTADFLGFARLTGRIGDRSGSFTMKSEGSYDGNEARSRWWVVPGSGTGDLSGLRGEGTSVAPHGPDGTFTLDYQLG